MNTFETEVINLKNIGPTTAAWLSAIGVNARQDLEQLGSVDAYRTIRAHGFNASLLLLYALEGALLDVHWNHLPAERKSRLNLDARK